MHLRGKAMMVEAILPNGQRQVISLVSDFNFNWMTTYVYADNVAPLLPKGTLLKVTAWHDNTAAKKSNPDPNQWVGWGDRTVDEMAHAWINIVYMKDEDYKAEQDKRRAAATSADAATTAVGFSGPCVTRHTRRATDRCRVLGAGVLGRAPRSGETTRCPQWSTLRRIGRTPGTMATGASSGGLPTFQIRRHAVRRGWAGAGSTSRIAARSCD